MLPLKHTKNKFIVIFFKKKCLRKQYIIDDCMLNNLNEWLVLLNSFTVKFFCNFKTYWPFDGWNVSYNFKELFQKNEFSLSVK